MSSSLQSSSGWSTKVFDMASNSTQNVPFRYILGKLWDRYNILASYPGLQRSRTRRKVTSFVHQRCTKGYKRASQPRYNLGQTQAGERDWVTTCKHFLMQHEIDRTHQLSRLFWPSAGIYTQQTTQMDLFPMIPQRRSQLRVWCHPLDGCYHCSINIVLLRSHMTVDHVMLTNVNVDAVFILCPFLTELHESFLRIQRTWKLILYIVPGLILRGQELPHLPTSLWRHAYNERTNW